MSDIDDVVVALKTRIAAGMLSAGDPIASRVFAYAPDSLNPPTAIVLPSPGDFVKFDVAFSNDGSDEFELVVKILMGTQDDRTGQAALLGYLSRSGTNSIRTAIYGDRTLGGTVSDVVVVGAQSYGDVEWAAQIFFGAELVVQAFT
jgi:hypothetical protein